MRLRQWLESYQLIALHDDSAVPDETFQIVSLLDDTVLYSCDRHELGENTAYDNLLVLQRLGQEGKADLRNHIGPACWIDFVGLTSAA